MADDEPMSSTSPRSGRRGTRTRAPRLSARPAATAFGVLATLLLAAAIASDTMNGSGRADAGAPVAPGPVTAVTAPAAPDPGAGGGSAGGRSGPAAPQPTPGTPTDLPSDAPTAPLTNPPPASPAATGVLLVLDEEMSDLLTYGEFDTVVQAMTGPVNTAANACGTSLAGMISAGGGLVVRLDDPSLNACLVTELAGVEHIVSAEEDRRATVQG